MTKIKSQLLGVFGIIVGGGLILYSQPHLKDILPATQAFFLSHNWLATSFLSTLLVSFAVPTIGAVFLPLMLVGFATGYMPIEYLFGALFVSGIAYCLLSVGLLTGKAYSMFSPKTAP